MKALLLVLLTSVLALSIVVSVPLPAAANDGYIACNDSNDVIPFDVLTYTLGTAIPLPHTYPYPYDATMHPDAEEVWVADASGDHVLVIDVDTNTITHTIPVGEYPNSIVFTQDGETALVSGRDANYVTLIKTADYSVTGTLPVLTGGGGTYDGPGQMALDSVSGNIYAVDWYDDTLYEIDRYGSSVLRHVDIGSSLWQLVVDPAGVYVYVTDRSTDEVIVVDRASLTEVTRVAVGDDPWGLDVTLDGSKLVVACEDDASVHIIDTSDWSTAVVALETGCNPKDVDILDEEQHAFIAGGDYSGTDAVYVIELVGNSLKQPIRVGGDPSCVAVQAQASGFVGVQDGPGERKLALECHPNPFNPMTRISYNMPESGDVELAVYDVSGRLVALIEQGPRNEGEHRATWHGLNDDGNEVSTGVYFLRLDALGTTMTAKAVLVK